MIKKIALACLFLVSITIHAQDSLKVKIAPNNVYKWMMLYKLNGAKQQCINLDLQKEEEFNFVIPENSESGMYRLFYDNKNGRYFDVIYNQEAIDVTFDASSPEKSAVFAMSEENKLYQSYLNSIESQQLKLDSIQIVNVNPTTPASIGLEKMYQKDKKVVGLQDYFEKEAGKQLPFLDAIAITFIIQPY